ncbi:MAG: hypothetical protein H6594_01335 [Flavobacteriales bacterium]|nr:hypothetical protein [Flavobacteriales bacterium]
MTLGKRHHAKDKDLHRVLDLRTRVLLDAVVNAPPGRTLEAYLKAFTDARGPDRVRSSR